MPIPLPILLGLGAGAAATRQGLKMREAAEQRKRETFEWIKAMTEGRPAPSQTAPTTPTPPSQVRQPQQPMQPQVQPQQQQRQQTPTTSFVDPATHQALGYILGYQDALRPPLDEVAEQQKTLAELVGAPKPLGAPDEPDAPPPKFRVNRISVSPEGEIAVSLEPNKQAEFYYHFRQNFKELRNLVGPVAAKQEALYRAMLATGTLPPSREFIDLLAFPKEQQQMLARNYILENLPRLGVQRVQTELTKLPDVSLEDIERLFGIAYNTYRNLWLTDPMLSTVLRQEVQRLHPDLSGEALVAEMELAASRKAYDLVGGVGVDETEAGRIRPQVTRIKDLPDEDIQQELIAQGHSLNDYVAREDIIKAREALQARRIEQIAQETQARTLAAERSRQAAAAANILPVVDELAEIITKLNTAEGLARFWETAKLHGWAFLQTGGPMIEYKGERYSAGELAAFYRDRAATALAQFARFFGERGVLTEFDVERAAKILPKLGDSRGVTMLKMKSFRTLIKEKMREAQQSHVRDLERGERLASYAERLVK